MNYEQLLNAYGWNYFEDCQCGGTYFRQFRSHALQNVGKEIWVATQLQPMTFRVKANAITIADDVPISQLRPALANNKI